MKKRFSLLFALLLLVLSQPLQAKVVSAYFSYGVYAIPAQSPYIEMYLRIPLSSLRFFPDGETYQAGANVQVAILENDSIIYFDNYTLHSPAVSDSNSAPSSMVDLKRTKLPEGKYRLALYIEDAYDTTSHAQMMQDIVIDFPETAAFSDVMLLDTLYPTAKENNFSRFNYDFIPSVLNSYTADRQDLLFYTELYNTPTLSLKDIKLSYYIKDAAGKRLQGYDRIKTKKAESLVYLFDGIDISGLPAGEYAFGIDLLDNAGKAIAHEEKSFSKGLNMSPAALNKGLFVQEMSVAQIRSFSEYLSSVSRPDETRVYNKLKDSEDTLALKSWFYQFWASRNAADPEKAYKNFTADVEFVKENFKTQLAPGYKTDRGTVYLKYGKPNYISPYLDEPNAYPYEIWQYYKAGAQSNVKFIFYNPTQLNNDYILLHTDMNGGVNNPKWREMIYRRTKRGSTIDSNSAPDGYGNNLDQRIRE